MILKLIFKFTVSTILLSLTFNNYSKAQTSGVITIEEFKSNIKNKEKENVVAQSDSTDKEIKFVLVNLENGLITYNITNDLLRRELFFNKEKRSQIESLPGLIELGVFSENLPLRIVVEENFAQKYLNEYFLN